MSSLSLDCGITHNTAKAWLSVLESSGIAYLLRPYHRNFGKRLVKRPKLFFVDSGLLCRLLGIKDSDQHFHHPNRGSVFESFAVAEMLKRRLNEGAAPDLFFWRDNIGTEIDVVFEEGPAARAVEIKSGTTFSPQFTKSLEAWMRYSNAGPADCSIIYGGDAEMSYQNIRVIPWDKAGTL